MPGRERQVYTIGHSTRSLDDFLGLLKGNGVACLVDVRSYPGSRRYPHFNKESLEQSVPAAGLRYRHLRRLGGRRKRGSVQDSPNDWWDNAAFRNYADYALTEEFRAGLEDLKALAAEQRCAVMCAEAVWWRCHRRIITDYLLAEGYEVLHILGENKVDPAEITESARPRGDGGLVYASGQQNLL